ncbi:MAG: hypothetical protein P1V97_14885 [Planctomycetota bacterium]|nr:hypothetical protein [Planctomycetota bacterium]
MAMRSLSKFVVHVCILGLLASFPACKPKGAKKSRAKHPAKSVTKVAQPWPAKVGAAFPDLKLKTLEGKEVKLSSFKGKVILFHLAGIQSPASTTIAGGNNWPPKKGKTGFPSLSHLLKSYGFEDNEKVMVVHGLLLDDQYDPPSLARAKEWAARYKLARSNVITLVGDKRHVKNDVAVSRSGTVYFIDENFKLFWECGLANSPHDLLRLALPTLYDRLAPKYGEFDIAQTERSKQLEKEFWKPLREKNWKSLEANLKATRNTKPEAGSTTEPLNRFMVRVLEEVYWPGQFNTWCKAQPKSAMAFLFRGRAGIDYAWAARGTGFANTVSNDAFKVFHERLLQAKSDLEKAATLDPDCPEAHSLRITVHKGLSQGRPHFQLLQKVIEKNPVLLDAYARSLSASFPKWGGSWEEAAKVIGIAEKNMKKDQRWKLLIFDFHLERAYRSTNSVAYLNQQEVRSQLSQAYKDLVKAFPKSLLPHSQALRWAATAKNDSQCRELRDKLAEMGHPGRIHQISRYHRDGSNGYFQDGYKAFSLMRRAGELGGMKGASDMAFYFRGARSVINRNQKYAMAWFRRSALLGSDWASKQIIDHYAEIKKPSAGQLKDLARLARWNYHRNRKGARDLLIQCLKKDPSQRRPGDPQIPR